MPHTCKRQALALLLAFFGWMGAVFVWHAPAWADDMSTDALTKQLEKVFRERPDIVMDVLRCNSESVLDIAQQGSNLRRKRNLEAQGREDMGSEKRVRVEGRPVLGSPKAKVRIIAFSDFTCHFCQQASVTVNGLLKEYGKDVSLIFKNIPLESNGIAGQAAACFLGIAQQSKEKSWQFYNTLFAKRDRLIGEGEEFIKKTAEDLGVDVKRMQRDAKSKKITDMLAEDQEDAQKLSVEGAPYFLVNNLVLRGVLPKELFKAAVDMALSQTGK